VILGVVLVTSFAVLINYGSEIYHQAPPVPERVAASACDETLFTGDDIRRGQEVWRSIGGHELGSVWGHGAYTAPDWTADWLHREATYLLERWAQAEHGAPFADLPAEASAALLARLQGDMRRAAYDPNAEQVCVSDDRAAAIAAVSDHYVALFGDDPALASLREQYAMPPRTVATEERARALTAFFFWAAWSCVTERPDSALSYTHNWPPDEQIGNHPSGGLVVVSVASFVLLLGGIAAIYWYLASRRREEERPQLPAADPLAGLSITPSMRATLKYFWIVGALIVAQMATGVIAAHYGVEGNGFYGIPLAEWIPYSLARTWHTQLGIFWIATSWLATGLLLAPAIAGREPRLQRVGVNALFVALVVVVGGSMAGEWLAIHQQLPDELVFWIGHQGLEYVDLGRVWQIGLFSGLLLWLTLMARALAPALRAAHGASRQLLALFILSAAAIALFYGAGLMYGRESNLAVAEYWRWWVVHLWVEGFFEVFATVVIAFLFTRLGLVRVRSATAGVLMSAILYLSGGIIGMFHHLYFTGTPPAVMALGGTFSALELMPLVLIGREAHENLRHARGEGWLRAYRWPLLFFVAVAFWNLVGAGLFGFLINPPIALYYMQGLNTTPVHGHTALFGVYGMLGIGLSLFSLRILFRGRRWRTAGLRASFWGINVGLALMVLLSLLPVGLAQTWASVEYGMWYARSAEFLQTPALDKLRWMRLLGDVVFAAGLLGVGYFVIGLSGGWSLGERVGSEE
jgi:nitric oxide reductase subunit B